jgi:hypothetical protein
MLGSEDPLTDTGPDLALGPRAGQIVALTLHPCLTQWVRCLP